MLRPLLISVSLLLATAVQAQKLVDPSKVAPEFREAAEKRRAEQIRRKRFEDPLKDLGLTPFGIARA